MGTFFSPHYHWTDGTLPSLYVQMTAMLLENDRTSIRIFQCAFDFFSTMILILQGPVVPFYVSLTMHMSRTSVWQKFTLCTSEIGIWYNLKSFWQLKNKDPPPLLPPNNVDEWERRETQRGEGCVRIVDRPEREQT